MLEQTKDVYNYYLVVSQTYFHNAPDESTKRSAYLIQGQLVFIEKTENGFGYTEYINTRGQTTKGWLKMSDLMETPDNYTKSDSFYHDVEHNIIHVVDSTMAFRCSILEFPAIKNQKLLHEIYRLIEWDVNDYSKTGLLRAIEKEKQKLAIDEGRKNVLQGYNFTFRWLDILLKISSVNNNIVTVEYVFDGDRGGAQWIGNTHLIFDKNSEQIITVSDILNNRENAAEWDQILRKHIKTNDPDNCVWDDPLIPVSDIFYFDKETITFVYQKYEIACGADGVIRITVPFSTISDYVKPDFKAKYLE